MNLTAHDYRDALAQFAERVDAVDDREWSAPTRCCPEWRVGDLVHHVADETAWVAPLLEGREPDDAQAEAGRQAADDPAEHWTSAAGTARRAVDAGVPAGSVTLPSGRVDADAYLAEVCCDTVIHTWDLADATGGDTRLPAELVEACAQWFDAVEDEWRDNGLIGPPADVPPGADAQTALLARFGRST